MGSTLPAARGWQTLAVHIVYGVVTGAAHRIMSTEPLMKLRAAASTEQP